MPSQTLYGKVNIIKKIIFKAYQHCYFRPELQTFIDSAKAECLKVGCRSMQLKEHPEIFHFR